MKEQAEIDGFNAAKMGLSSLANPYNDPYLYKLWLKGWDSYWLS